MITTTCTAWKFLSTLSLRRATALQYTQGFSTLFLSTLSLRRATVKIPANIMLHSDFYPRSPCGERPITTTMLLQEVTFLSTLSLRRATFFFIMAYPLVVYFYPRSPCGERPNWFDLWGWAEYFYPRSPCGERPDDLGARLCDYCISIHALLAESDTPLLAYCQEHINFYPRSPCGERRVRHIIDTRTQNFYPRSPCGERRGRRVGLPVAGHFYPRSPCGERPMTLELACAIIAFLSTLSLRRATRLYWRIVKST